MLKLIGAVVVILILVQFISGLIQGSREGHNRAMRDGQAKEKK